METTAFAELVSHENSDEKDSAPKRLVLCSEEPFVLTYKTNPSDVSSSFDHWIDAALALALKEYGERL